MNRQCQQKTIRTLKYDYDHTVDISFEEFYKYGGNSIYFNENSNTWRGFMTMLVNQVKDGKIMKLTEQPLMGQISDTDNQEQRFVDEDGFEVFTKAVHHDYIVVKLTGED